MPSDLVTGKSAEKARGDSNVMLMALVVLLIPSQAYANSLAAARERAGPVAEGTDLEWIGDFEDTSGFRTNDRIESKGRPPPVAATANVAYLDSLRPLGGSGWESGYFAELGSVHGVNTEVPSWRTGIAAEFAVQNLLGGKP